MVNSDIISLKFELSILKLTGQQFEDFFVKIMTAADSGFRPVKASGSDGDGGNDGFCAQSGTYYQVYAPEDPQKNQSRGAEKLEHDFKRLYEYWNEICPIKKFYFVINDHERGATTKITKKITELRSLYKEIEINSFLVPQLKEIFKSLTQEQQCEILGLNFGEMNTEQPKEHDNNGKLSRGKYHVTPEIITKIAEIGMSYVWSLEGNTWLKDREAAKYLLCLPEWLPSTEQKLQPLSEIKVKDCGSASVPLPNKSKNYSHYQQLSFNRNHYALYDWSGDINKGTLELQCWKGEFKTYINTCVYLEHESIMALNSDDLSITSENMPYRVSLGDLSDTKNRFSIIGVNAVTILYNVHDEDDSDEVSTYFILHNRTQNVSTGKSAFHAVPAGYYEIDDPETDADLTNTVYRKFASEVLAKSEFDRTNNYKIVHQILDCTPPVLYLGMGLNPVNGHAEILAVMQLNLADDRMRKLMGGINSKNLLENHLEKINNALIEDEKSIQEGKIELRAFTEEWIQLYKNNSNSEPAFRCIMALLEEHFNELVKIDKDDNF